MQLKLFNTLTCSKQVFQPLQADHVGIYSCGPTVYAPAHIGNLRSYLFPDLLKRVLLSLGFKVYHVMNITDVGHLTSDADEGEDKLEQAARTQARSAWEIAEEYTACFVRDIKRLQILLPDEMPRATDHIPEQVALIKRLESKGFTYRTEDGIYYHTGRFGDYGCLGRLDIEGLHLGERVAAGGKREKTDFALWKFTPAGVKRQMEWDSPWGRGFPGWHIECSAMAMKYLSEAFDIHTGGTDHIPVHHTNEIAQSEAATGRQFVHYWLHGAFLVVEKGRMGKSEGNMLGLDALVKRGMEPLVFRYLAMNSHYRQFLHFSWDALQAADTALMGLRRLIHAAVEASGGSSEVSSPQPAGDALQQGMMEALCDDLNAPRALGLLWQALKNDSLDAEEKCQLAVWAEAILGLGMLDFSRLQAAKQDIPQEVAALAESRWQARQQKDWKKSDELRQSLLKAGYAVQDSQQGYRLERLNPKQETSSEFSPVE